MRAAATYVCSTPVDGIAKRFSASATISEIGENSSSGAQSQEKVVFPIKRKKLKKRKNKRNPRVRIIRSKKRITLEDSDLNATSDSHKNLPLKTIGKYSERNKSLCSGSSFRQQSRDSKFVLYGSLLSVINANTTPESIQDSRELIQRGIDNGEEEQLRKRCNTDGVRTYPAPVRQSQHISSYLNHNAVLATKDAKHGRPIFDTATSNMLWDEFVKKNPNTVGKYLEGMRKRLSFKRKFFKHRLPGRSLADDNDNHHRVEQHQKQDTRKRSAHSKNRTVIVRGYSTRDTGEFTIVYDVQ